MSLHSAGRNTDKNGIGQAAIIFINFFLVLTIYYVIRPVRNALVDHQLGAVALPYIWIGTGISIFVVVMAYEYLLSRSFRRWLLALSTLFFGVLLLGIQAMVGSKIWWVSGALYIWGDLFSVVMVEQLWSFTNDVFDTEHAKRWYPFIGSGLIAGGFCGSTFVSLFVSWFGTLNLLYVCQGLLLLLLFTSAIAQRMSRSYLLARPAPTKANTRHAFRMVIENHYLTLLLLLVLFTQVITNLVDFEFNRAVEVMYATMDNKAGFLAKVDLWTNIASLVTMAAVVRPVQRYLGVLAGLLVLPLSNILGFGVLFYIPLPLLTVILRISNKSLGYSIHRVSKELLYIPLAADVKYRAKAIIDMLAYRFSSMAASIVILPLLAWTSIGNMSGISLVLSFAQVGVVIYVTRAYKVLTRERLEESTEPEQAAYPA